MGRGTRSDVAATQIRGGQDAGAPYRATMTAVTDQPEPSSLAGVPVQTRAKRLLYDERRSPVDGLMIDFDRGLNLDPPYQRGHVWGEDRQRNLIRSLLLGLPIGGVWINERDVMEPRVVIDGKQRLTALRAWTSGQLAVPAGWFTDTYFEGERPADDTMVTFEDLSDAGKRKFCNHSAVTVYMMELTGPDAVEREREVFELINSGGLAQGDADPDAPDAR